MDGGGCWREVGTVSKPILDVWLFWRDKAEENGFNQTRKLLLAPANGQRTGKAELRTLNSASECNVFLLRDVEHRRLCGYIIR